MIKKFVRGNKERGAEVIKALKDLGGVNKGNLKGDDPNCVYVININSVITRWHYDTEYAFMIQECFEEIKLADKKVVTNKQFADWYLNYVFISEIVQYRVADNGSIYSRMYDYVNDDDPTPVRYIRFNFGEWLPIDKVDII